MSALQLVVLVAWCVLGTLILLVWKIREPEEVTMLDVVCCIILGSLFGVLIYVAVQLHKIKLRGAKEAA